MSIVISVYDPSITYAEQKKFDCGNAVINAFVRGSLKQQVRRGLCVAHVLTDTANADRFVGFYTITQFNIDVSLLSVMTPGSLPSSVPCSRVVMLGVDKAYQKKKLGARLMKHALSTAKSVAALAGSFGVYLDADPAAFSFYVALGFVALEGNKSPDSSPMFLPITAIP
jgi:GNAT superfamily N-acetyltransferase